MSDSPRSAVCHLSVAANEGKHAKKLVIPTEKKRRNKSRKLLLRDAIVVGNAVAFSFIYHPSCRVVGSGLPDYIPDLTNIR
jgi:hypothetical protein